MNFKYAIKKCVKCDCSYKLNPEKYFLQYCTFCCSEKEEIKQEILDLRIKNYMILKYRGTI